MGAGVEFWRAGWVCVLAAAALAGSVAGESFLNSIGRNLRAQMSGVLEMATVNYSRPALNVTYTASVQFDMRAMGMIYNSTHIVIDAIAQKQAYPKGIVSVSDGHVEVAPGGVRAHWRPLLAHYGGPLAVLLVALLIVPVLPLAGLFWCCCYWCRGGRRRRPFDRKYDGCLKGLLAILLIALLTLFLFGVVCAFATDSQVEEGAGGAGAAAAAGIADAQKFLNHTQAHAHHLLVVNYKELEKKLTAMLTSSGMTISGQLGEFSRAVSVTTLTGMVQQLGAVRRQLRDVQRLTTDLRHNADKLNAALRIVKQILLTTLSSCQQPQCIQLNEKYKIGQLDTEIHYSQMPDVSELLSNVTALMDSNIKQEVEEGQQVFLDIKREIQRSIDEHIPSVEETITRTGAELSAVSARISAAAGNASEALGRARAPARLRALLAQYGPYRRMLGITAAALLLAVMCVLSWGLMCGVCGKRPDVYGASDCCNKGAGSKCLLCGMVVMFVVGGAVSLVLAAYFAAGVAAQRFICDPLTEPRANRLFTDVERFVDLEWALYNNRTAHGFNLTYVITSCHANRTIYDTLQLWRVYNLSSLRGSVRASVVSRLSALGPLYRPRRPPLAILKPSAKRKLAQFADSGLSDFDFDRILHALETNMTSLALDGLSSQLSSAATQLSGRAGFEDVSAELARAADKLRDADTNILQHMLRDTATLNTTAMELRDRLRFNHSSLKEAISYLLDETSQAESFLNTQGPALVQNMTHEFAEVVVRLLEQYLALVERGARADVGRCGPLSNAFNATRDAHCHKILMPVNGYWMSLSWCVLLFVPLMVVSVRLAKLYLHLDPYPGPLVEAEYLYDAYADRDNVPLANAYKAEKRGVASRGGRGAGAGAGAGGAGPAAARADAPAQTPVDAHHARRYNDMAPKHWEEGPPRYHGPTEYERPPPYYYPGPNDRQ